MQSSSSCITEYKGGVFSHDTNALKQVSEYPEHLIARGYKLLCKTPTFLHILYMGKCSGLKFSNQSKQLNTCVFSWKDANNDILSH